MNGTNSKVDTPDIFDEDTSNRIKSDLEKDIEKFNRGFKSFGFHNQLSIYICPFGGRGNLIPVPDRLRARNTTAAEFIDSYNEFIALNHKTLKKYLLNIISSISSLEEIKFIMVKNENCELSHKMTFDIKTNEQNLLEAMPKILNHYRLNSPIAYSLDDTKCSFYFNNSTDLRGWELCLHYDFDLKLDIKSDAKKYSINNTI